MLAMMMRRMTMVMMMMMMMIMRHYCCCFSITLTASHLIRTSSPFSSSAAESADTREFIFRIRNMFEWQVFALRPGRNLHVTCAELWGVGVGSSSGGGMCVRWGGWGCLLTTAEWQWQPSHCDLHSGNRRLNLSCETCALYIQLRVGRILLGKILFAKFFHNPWHTLAFMAPTTLYLAWKIFQNWVKRFPSLGESISITG